MRQLDLFGFEEPVIPAKQETAEPAEKNATAGTTVLPAEEVFFSVTEEQPVVVFAEEPQHVIAATDAHIVIAEPLQQETIQPMAVQSKTSTVTAIHPLKKRGRKSFKEMDAEVDLIEVPEDEILFQKQYYSISTVAGWFRVNTSLLRFWENEFDVLKPRKNRKGDRLFRPEDVKNLQVIYYLLRQRKFSIEGAKKYLKSNKKNADTSLQLVQSLTKFKSFLLELKANLYL